jgi:hypothetical protein
MVTPLLSPVTAAVTARSDRGAPAVGGDHRAGDVPGLVRGEEGDDVGDLSGCAARASSVVPPSASIRSGAAPPV